MSWNRLVRSELLKMTSTKLPWAFLAVLVAISAITAAAVVFGHDMDGSKDFISTAADQQSLMAFAANAFMGARPRDRQRPPAVRPNLPCPHDRPCPLDGDDWCHFAVRLPRSAGHRSAKAAQAGFEDEKFAYVVTARQEVVRADARILRHPQVRGGHVRLELCAEEGLRSAVVAKSDRAAFRAARKASWGDAFGGAPPDRGGQ